MTQTYTRIIPGYRQDHNGQTYQIVIETDERGQEIRQTIQYVEVPALSQRLQQGLEKVTVESQGRRGTTYESLVCYQNLGG